MNSNQKSFSIARSYDQERGQPQDADEGYGGRSDTSAERPGRQADVLASVLSTLRLSEARYCASDLSAPWAIHFAARNNPIFHVVDRGSAWLTIHEPAGPGEPGEVPLALVGGDVVLHGVVEIAATPARLVADWERDIQSHLQLESGDVEALPLARTRARWPGYAHSVQAAEQWMHRLGVAGLLDQSDVALMACRGARYHHDASQYGDSAFCNLFLSEDKGLDVHFPSSGQRIALQRGTVLVFDTAQPHAVVRRGQSTFSTANFPDALDCSLVFLTWELPIEHDRVRQLLRLQLDSDPITAQCLREAQVHVGGSPATVCPDSGRWCPAAEQQESAQRMAQSSAGSNKLS